MIDVIERPKVEIVAVLRRGELDVRDTRIMRVVVNAWKEGRTVTYREIEASTELSTSVIRYRIWGYDSRGPRRGGGLIERGWLQAAAMAGRTIRPGPRFAGMDHGHPLERISV